MQYSVKCVTSRKKKWSGATIRPPPPFENDYLPEAEAKTILLPTRQFYIPSVQGLPARARGKFPLIFHGVVGQVSSHISSSLSLLLLLPD
jgi:hypothetical protein